MDNLKASLENLRNNLASSGPVDPDLHGQLQQLDGDIKGALERRELAEATPVETTETGVALVPVDEDRSTTYGLAERTREMSAKFAAEHPKLESALRELGTQLSNLGI